MKTKFYSFFIFSMIIAGAMVSCKSVNKLYQNGDYDQAVYTAVKKMHKNKLTPQTKALITDAYGKAMEQYKIEIDYLVRSNDLYKWEAVLNKYEKAQQLTNAILKSEEAMQYVSPVDYSSALQLARQNAVAVRKQRGQYFMDQNNKAAAQQAYHEFARAYSLSNDLEFYHLKEEAFNRAVTNIVVAPMQTRYYTNNYAVQNLENNLLCNLQNSNSSLFVKYYSTYQARNKNIKADQVMELFYDGIQADRASNHTKEVSVQKNNVLIREVVIRPDSIVKEYGTVYAKYTTHQSTQNYTGKIFIQINDAGNNQSLISRNIEASYCINSSFASFTGDERALSTEQKREVDKGRNNSNNNHEEMVRNITETLTRKIQDEVRYYWN